MKYQANNQGEQNVHYSINRQKTQGIFDILHEISENVTLVQLTGSVGNVNNSVSIVGYWIFDSK